MRRPLIPRVLPWKVHNEIDYAQIAVMKEQQRIDELLYT
jgi:hypothetical protein